VPGGHYAAWEQPKLFSQEVRAAFRPLRKSTCAFRARALCARSVLVRQMPQTALAQSLQEIGLDEQSGVACARKLKGGGLGQKVAEKSTQC
jgi:hypothetical protein